jgi:lipoyl(octanoyl) transferase
VNALPLPLHVRHTAHIDYMAAWQEMRAFTDTRGPDTEDQLWFLEHPSVFTLGQAGRAEHLLAPGDIPVIKTDRGGQVTWHGPGQCVVYLLLDLRRLGIGVRALVDGIEAAVIGVLAEYGIEAAARRDAPGVYVNGAKIASLGLRVRRGCSYHGLAFNLDPDLEPFGRINPCGYAGLPVTRLVDLAPPRADCSREHLEQRLEWQLRRAFGYDAPPRAGAGRAPPGA